MRNPNNLSFVDRQKLKGIDWRDPRQITNLEDHGINYFDPELLPTWIPPHVHRALYLRGWCPPNGFPTYYPDNQHEITTKWLGTNFHRLKRNGIHYLGNEPNFQPAENFDKKPLRVCFGRVSEYEILEGGFGQYLIANFVEDHDERIFFDFAFAPPLEDMPKMIEADIPFLTGVISKRPISDFDIVLFGVTIAEERLHLPQLLIRSGVALRRYQRFNKAGPHYSNPIISMGGIGSLFSENICGDHPEHGPAMNGMTDVVSLGEGELLSLKLCQRILQYREAGKDKTDLLNELGADKHCGVYNPARIAFEYHDKTHRQFDHTGAEIGTPNTYPGAGPIKQINLIDHETQTRYVLAGPGNEAYNDMEEMQKRFIANFDKDLTDDEVAEKYIRVDKRPSREERRRMFQKINGETAAMTGVKFSVARARADAIADGVDDVEGYIERRRIEHETENKEADLAKMDPRDAFRSELMKAPQARNNEKARTTLIDTISSRTKFRYTAPKVDDAAE